MSDWSFELLEFLIQDRGDEVIHEIAVACPCRGEDHYASLITDQNRPARKRSLDCDQCDGNGWLYRNARVVKGLVTSVNSGNRSLIEAGYAEPGDCVFSPSLDIGIISDFDRITFTYPAPLDQGQQIMRNAANMEDNKGLNTRLQVNEDRLWYIPEQCIWCEDQNGVVYQQNLDFVFDKKIIRWIGNKPADGVFYTIKYTAFLEWICYSTPMTRIDRARNLGQKVLLKKVHVAFPNDEASTPSERQEKQITFTTRSKL